MAQTSEQDKILLATGLTPDAMGRLEAITARRGWQLKSERGEFAPDVWLGTCRSLAEGEKQLVAQWDVLQEHIVRVRLQSAEQFNDAEPASERLYLGLDSASDEECWERVLASAFRAAEMLRRQHRRIVRLEKISTTDALTGTYNRMHVMTALDVEFRRFQRIGEPLSCIMIDLDHFKNINDTYGHALGDRILAAFASKLQAMMRRSDIVGRYGGEEFLCIVPNTDLRAATGVAEKLRKAIEKMVFTEGPFSIDITASFGVASADQPEVHDVTQLLQYSDRAMYQAKRLGRNRVCLFNDHADAGGHEARDGSAEAANESPRRQIAILHPRPETLSFYEALADPNCFELRLLNDGKEALEYLTHNDPLAVFVYENLPEGAGLDVLERCKGRQLESLHPRILIRAAGSSLQDADAWDAGADAILNEDVTPAEFATQFHTLVELRHARDRIEESANKLSEARSQVVKSERLSAMGQMATGVAHDFNNLLSAILGRTQQILRSCPDDSVRSGLNVIHQAASDGAETVRRIQEFSRHMSEIDATAVNVRESIEDCVQLTRVRWKDEALRLGVNFSVDNEVDRALGTMANPTELREVFTNLLVNAFDAMPEGGVVTVRSRRADGDDGFFIDVSDEGIGMERFVAQKIFEPFYTTKKEHGTGLGLSIIYGIMTRIGGRIEVRSELGIGTTFELYFPEVVDFSSRPASDNALDTQVESAPEPSQGSALRVLVVEDEKSVRELIGDVLREPGHEVVETDCAEAAIEALGSSRFDLVITDLSMPDRPGWDVAAFVKERHPETLVVLSSGWADDFTPEYLAGRGVDHWLPKPVSLDALFAMLRLAGGSTLVPDS